MGGQPYLLSTLRQRRRGEPAGLHRRADPVGAGRGLRFLLVVSEVDRPDEERSGGSGGGRDRRPRARSVGRRAGLRQARSEPVRALKNGPSCPFLPDVRLKIKDLLIQNRATLPGFTLSGRSRASSFSGTDCFVPG